MLPLLLLLLLLATTVNACKSTYPFELDVGIFWFYNHGTKLVKSCINGTLEGQDLLDEQQSLIDLGAVDPNRNTLIITHGLSSDSTISRQRFGDEEGFSDLAEIWLSRGWNVGIFRWSQLADHGVERFMLSESNLYVPKYYTTMEYKHVLRATGELIFSDVTTDESVTDMFVRHYAAHFAAFPPSSSSNHEIRLGGHSLGGQLILLTANAINKNPAILAKPQRVFVLDIVFSSGPKGFFDDVTDCESSAPLDIPTVLGCYVAQAPSIAFEFYRASAINRCLYSSENYPAMIRKSTSAVFVTVKMDLWGTIPLGQCYSDSLFTSESADTMSALSIQMKNQHIHIVPYYLSSLIYTPHLCNPIQTAKEVTSCSQTSNIAPSAQLSTPQILSMAQSHEQVCFKQYPLPPTTLDFHAQDDLFYVIPCNSVNL